MAVEVGDYVPLSFRVINHQRSLVDATVTFTVEQPDGSYLLVSATRDSLGCYSGEFVPTQAGRHVVTKAAAGAFERVEIDVLNVGPGSAGGAVAIISLAEAKEHLNLTSDDEDDELRGYIAAASRVVERHTGRIVARRTVVEDHVLDASGVVVLHAAPVVSLTSVVATDGTVLDVADMTLDPASGIVEVAATGAHRFTFVAGEAVVPEDTIKAAQIICAHLWQTQRVPIGSAPAMGGFDTPAPVSGRGYLIPNQAAQLLGGRGPNPP